VTSLNPNVAVLSLKRVRYVIAQYSKDPNKDYKAAIEDFNQARRDPADAVLASNGDLYGINLYNTAEIRIETTRQIEDFNQALR